MKRKAIGFLTFSLALLLLATGCSRNKELKRQSAEQARVIADLNQEVTQLKEELGKLKAAPAPAGQVSQYPVAGQKNTQSYLK